MPNIQFNYRYRDSANYKNFGSVIFSNPQNLTLEYVTDIIKSKLIDETWFYASKWNLPNLFSEFNPAIDPSWHEFESVEYTNATVNVQSTINELIEIA